MATSRSSASVEDAVVASPARSGDRASAATLQADLKTSLEVCERCARWSRQAQVAQAEVLDGLATAMAGAAASLDGDSGIDEIVALSDKLWRTAFDEARRRFGDLPYSLAALNFDIAQAWMARVQDRLHRSTPSVTPVAAIDPAQLYDQARASLDQWMTQWSSMWQARPVQAQ